MVWFLEVVRTELPKTFLGVCVSAIGFLIALAIDGVIERSREQSTFKSMLVALHAEADANKDVIGLGWNQFFPDRGIVLREFRTATAQGLLANPLFMKYASDTEITSVSACVSVLALQNSYRRILETFEIENSRSSSQQLGRWLRGAQDVAGSALQEAETCIDNVKSITR